MILNKEINLQLILLSVCGQREYLLPDENTYGFPSRIFYEILEQSGYGLTSSLDGDFLLCINHNSRSYKKFLRKGNLASRTILIRTEPKSVYPTQYESRIEKLYGLVLTPGGINESCLTTEFIPQPYQFQNNHGGPAFSDPNLRLLLQQSIQCGKFSRLNWDDRSKNVVMLASNKFSPCVNSGYSIRRKIARIGADKNKLEIYGMYWKSSLFHKLHIFLAMFKFNLLSGYIPRFKLEQFGRIRSVNIMGESVSKLELLDDSKFSLVVENSDECITEKLFDAFFLGVIPIYIGPKIGELGIPEETFIQIDWDLSNFSSVFTSLNELDVESYLDAIGTFISSDNFWSKWHEDSVYNDIVCRINIFINALNGSASEEIPN